MVDELRVPVIRQRARLLTDDGHEHEVIVFLAPAQAPEDVFESNDVFFPVDEGGRIRIYARKTLAAIEVPKPRARPVDDDEIPRSRRTVRVGLRDGRTLTGELEYVVSEGRRRTADILNEPTRSFALYEGDIVRHVAKAQVGFVEEA